MISTLRNGIQKAGYKYIIWGMLFVFIVSGTGLFVGLFTGRNTGVVARVNGDPITQLELRSKTHVLDQMIKDIKQQFKEYAPYFLQAQGLTGNPQDIALNELVREKLLLQACNTLGLRSLSEDYIAEKLANQAFTMQHLGLLVPPYLYNSLHEFDARALQNYLRRQGMSVERFDNEVASALKQHFIVSLLPSTVFVSPQALERIWAQEHASRTFKILEIDLDDYVTQVQKNPATEKELKDYFTQHNASHKRYWTVERRSGTVWKFSADSYGITLSDAELKTAYENNKNRWPGKNFDAVRKDLEKELLQAKFHQRFNADVQRITQQANVQALEQFAKKHGGKKTALNDETLKPDSALIAKLFALKAPGKTGSVVAQNEGSLVVLDAVKERVSRPFSEVKAEVERDYYQEKASQALVNDLKKFVKEGSVDLFTTFAREKGLSSRTLKIAGDDAKAWTQAEQDGLPAARMKRMTHPGTTLVQMTPEGAVIVLLDAYTPGDAKMDEAQKKALAKKLQAQELNVMSAAFIASLQNNAKIEII